MISAINLKSWYIRQKSPECLLHGRQEDTLPTIGLLPHIFPIGYNLLSRGDFYPLDVELCISVIQSSVHLHAVLPRFRHSVFHYSDIIARHCGKIIVQIVNLRKGLGAFSLQVLLAKPLVVGICVLHCHKFWISAILWGDNTRHFSLGN